MKNFNQLKNQLIFMTGNADTEGDPFKDNILTNH